MKKRMSIVFIFISLIILISAVSVLAGLWGDIFSGVTGMSTSSGPNLNIQSYTITPENPVLGDTITLEVIVENNGDERALSQTTLGQPTSTKNTVIIYGANPQALNSQAIIDLQPGEMQTFTFIYNAINEGEDSFSIKIDDKDSYAGKKVPIDDRSGTVVSTTVEISSIPEEDETPSDPDDTSIPTSSGPNLNIQSYTITPENPVLGDTITIDVIVENNGDERALSQNSLGNPVSTKNTLIVNGANPQLLKINEIIDLEAGETQTFTFNYNAVNEGQDTFSIKIDDKDSYAGKKVPIDDRSGTATTASIEITTLSEETCPLLGDVNYDGDIDNDDVNLVQIMIVEGMDLDICGDMNQDGEITIDDVELILSEIPQIIEQCTDGTISGSCSINNPLRCEIDILVNDCQNCGCSLGQECQSDGSCAENLCKTVKYSGDPEDKLDILYIGDDYSSSEQSKFKYDVQRFMNNLLSYEPFKSQSDKINVYRIDGVDDLGCNYNCGGTARRICCDSTKIAQLASQCPYDQIAIIVNNEQYGGSGGTYAISYRGNPMTGLHEFGHSFGRLRDEYSYGSYNGYDRSAYLGMTGNCDPTPGCPLWEDVPGAGCILGCQYDEWYRPAPTQWRGGSIMRDSEGDFNPVGEKILSEKLEAYS
jgi:hypothetical protein